jgi:hypothetical protein
LNLRLSNVDGSWRRLMTERSPRAPAHRCIAPGYNDFNDHDYLRHDLVLAVLAGKSEETRSGC